jgi:hypothetical protein
MNLPEAMSMYGPLRHLWEGGTRGEGFLRFAKPLMLHGTTKPDWTRHLLQRLQTMQAFDNILPTEHACHCSVAASDALRYRKSKFQKLSSREEATTIINQCQPQYKCLLSVIVLDNGLGECNLYCVVGDYQTVLLITVDKETPTQTKFGLVYHKCNASQSVVNWIDDITPHLGSKARMGFGMLLPMLANDDHSENSRLFALVSSNWGMLDDSNSLMDLIDRDNH